LEKIFIVSPNVRLERPECGKLGRYLIEFTQVDMEMRGASKSDYHAPLRDDGREGNIGRGEKKGA